MSELEKIEQEIEYQKRLADYLESRARYEEFFREAKDRWDHGSHGISLESPGSFMPRLSHE